MILILTALAIGAFVSWALFWYSELTNGVISGFFGLLIAIGVGLGAISYAFMAWSWIASEHKVVIINRTYGTHYTQEEIFYASNVIEEIRQLDRNRYEINGNIARELKPAK